MRVCDNSFCEWSEYEVPYQMSNPLQMIIDGRLYLVDRFQYGSSCLCEHCIKHTSYVVGQEIH